MICIICELSFLRVDAQKQSLEIPIGTYWKTAITDGYPKAISRSLLIRSDVFFRGIMKCGKDETDALLNIKVIAMQVLYILLPLFGALPLIITIIKMRRANRITKNGITTEAVVVQVFSWGTTIRNKVDTLILQYTVEATNQIYQGKATAFRVEYKVGDKLAITYSNKPPYEMTVKGANVYIPILVFTILIFLFVIFAMFKIEELIPEGGYHFG